MKAGKEGGQVQILDWEQLKGKARNEQEELLFQSVYKLEPAYWNGVKSIEGYLYGAFCLHEEGNGERRIASAAFLLGKDRFDLVLLKDEKGMFAPIREENGKEPSGEGMQEHMEAVFEGILKRGQKRVADMEKYLIEIEREIVIGKVSRNQNRTIFECKRSLSVWKNDYVQILNIVEGINGLEQKKGGSQSQLLTEEAACYFRIYENKLRRLTEETQFLYEELVHVREALDAALSYEQNRIMKVFTTVTTIFMPLTLITGWYGMNFVWMPELQWKYGYVSVGLLSLLVLLACAIFFKRKSLF